MPDDVGEWLGPLLKHARLRFTELQTAALGPLGISGRECATLITIGASAPPSQQELARRLGVDRTSTVALVDDLEHKHLVARQQDPTDRRKNVVALTSAGRETLHHAVAAARDAERRFLDGLSPAEAARFRRALRIVAADAGD